MSTFNELAIGTAFRCKGGEKISNSVYAKNDSVYVKVGHNAAVDAVNVGEDGTYTDHIFHLLQRVTPIPWKARMEYIPQWWTNGGGHASI